MKKLLLLSLFAMHFSPAFAQTDTLPLPKPPNRLSGVYLDLHIGGMLGFFAGTGLNFRFANGWGISAAATRYYQKSLRLPADYQSFLWSSYDELRDFTLSVSRDRSLTKRVRLGVELGLGHSTYYWYQFSPRKGVFLLADNYDRTGFRTTSACLLLRNKIQVTTKYGGIELGFLGNLNPNLTYIALELRFIAGWLEP